MSDFWIILTGILVAVPCALLGSFLVLRKMVMVGDAISHAVLPGIVIAYMITHSFDSFIMLIGAAAIGLVTTLLIEFFHRVGRVQQDASIGVTFTWLFAIGVILVSVFTSGTDLDQDCVLYGEILTVQFKTWITSGGTDLGPTAVWFLGFLNITILFFVFFGFRGLQLTTFDSAFAVAVGINAGLWHYLLMSAVSFTTVASFESVGAILVIAFLVAPAATAYLITTNLKRMLLYSCAFGISSVFLGYYVAYLADVSISGAMASMSGIQFALVLLVWPGTGLAWKKKPIALQSTSEL